jgi:TPR repeat protein
MRNLIARVLPHQFWPMTQRRRRRTGDAHAQSNLGMMYRAGDCVSQDDAQAMWFRRVPEQESARAQDNLDIKTISI